MFIVEDRIDAGEQLAKKVARSLPEDCNEPIVLGIPKGGIAVGLPVAEKLNCPLEPITVRKLPLPMNDQMGFGAVTVDREVILNEELVKAGYVTKTEIEPIIDTVYREVLRRDQLYRKNLSFPDIAGRCVIIVDDGLATGYTMLAAIALARRKNASMIIAAIPVAHYESYHAVEEKADKTICLFVDRTPSFAVASYYVHFPDMSDSEVLAILEQAKTAHPRGKR